MVRVLAGQGAREDVEELTADVFLALWAHAGELNLEQGLRLLAGDGGPEQGVGLAAHPQRGRPLTRMRRAPGGGTEAEAERREWAARLWDAVEGLTSLTAP